MNDLEAVRLILESQDLSDDVARRAALLILTDRPDARSRPTMLDGGKPSPREPNPSSSKS